MPDYMMKNSMMKKGSMPKKKKSKSVKGLTIKQKKLPIALQKAILRKMNK